MVRKKRKATSQCVDDEESEGEELVSRDNARSRVMRIARRRGTFILSHYNKRVILLYVIISMAIKRAVRQIAPRETLSPVSDNSQEGKLTH